MVLVFIFWALDAQYLRQEKWFRDMYDLARVEKPEEIDFNLTPPLEVRERTSVKYGFTSWSTWWLYLPLIAISLVLWLMLA